MCPRKPRTMTDPWPITGHVTIWRFFMLMIDIFGVYTGSNGLWHTSVSRFALHKHQDWWCAPGFIVGVLSFSCHGWLHSRMCLCDQFFIKVLDPDIQTELPGMETFCTCLYGLMLERKYVQCSSGWGRTWKHAPDLSGLYSILSLSIFCCIKT